MLGPCSRLFLKVSGKSLPFSKIPFSSNLFSKKTDFFIAKKADVRSYNTLNDFFDEDNNFGDPLELNVYSAKNMYTPRFIGIQYDPTLVKVMKPKEREAAARTISHKRIARFNPSVKTTVKIEEPLDFENDSGVTPTQEKQRQLRIEPLLDQMRPIIPTRQTTSSSDGEASILAIKRTWQPKKGKRRKKHGFLVRLKSVGGRRILQRRKLKKRKFMTV